MIEPRHQQTFLPGRLLVLTQEQERYPVEPLLAMDAHSTWAQHTFLWASGANLGDEDIPLLSFL